MNPLPGNGKLPSAREIPSRLTNLLRPSFCAKPHFDHTGHETAEQEAIERELLERLRNQKQLDLYELFARRALNRSAVEPLEFTLGTCPLCQRRMRYRTCDGTSWEGIERCPAEPATQLWAELVVTGNVLLFGPHLHSLLPNPIHDQAQFEAEVLCGIYPGSQKAAALLLQRYAAAGAFAVPVRHHACLMATTVPDQLLLLSPGLEPAFLSHPSRVTATSGNRIVMIMDGARRPPGSALPTGTVSIPCRPGRYRFTINPAAYHQPPQDPVFGSLTRMSDDIDTNNNPD